MRIEACRACGATELAPIMSLGALPLANALVEPDAAPEPDQRFPLDLVLSRPARSSRSPRPCRRSGSSRDYLYFSSFSDTMLRHARALAERWSSERGLGADSLVVEVASNDGYLLAVLPRPASRCSASSPAPTSPRSPSERGMPTVAEFFGGSWRDGCAPKGGAPT